MGLPDREAVLLEAEQAVDREAAQDRRAREVLGPGRVALGPGRVLAGLVRAPGPADLGRVEMGGREVARSAGLRSMRARGVMAR
jgi:hypothetical protein